MQKRISPSQKEKNKLAMLFWNSLGMASTDFSLLAGEDNPLSFRLSSLLEYSTGYQHHQHIASKLLHWNSNYIQNTHLQLLLFFFQMVNSIPPVVLSWKTIRVPHVPTKHKQRRKLFNPCSQSAIAEARQQLTTQEPKFYHFPTPCPIPLAPYYHSE